MSSPQRDGASVVVKNLLLQGSARAPQKSDLEVKLCGIALSCTWQSCVSKSPKPPLYIGGGEGQALRHKGLKVRQPPGGGGLLLQFGLGRRSPPLQIGRAHV